MPRDFTSRFTTGSVLVVIGLVLLLWTTGVVRMGSVWGWIAGVFVVLGVWGLVRSGFRNLVGPVMIIAIAGTVVVQSLGLLPAGAVGRWWPVFIVLFGVLVIISRSRRRKQLRVTGRSVGGEVTVVSVFGDDRRRVTTDSFTGAEVLALFGSAVLDVREATPAVKPAVVDVVSVFGDAEVRVPPAWDVRLETLAIFGDTNDRRPRVEPGESQSEPVLVITGVAVFGNIEITD